MIPYGEDYDDDGSLIPHGEDLDGAEVLAELHAALTRYVVLPSPEAADAIVLWIAATHAAPAWNCAPRLDVTSPVKRCGKSRLLDIIEATCHDPLLTVNISPAALVRSIGDDPPTLLLDEADTVFGPKAGDNHEDLRGILNAGHSRNRPYIRWDVASQGNRALPHVRHGRARRDRRPARHDHRPGGRGDDAPPGTRRGGRPVPRPPRRRAAQGARRAARGRGSAPTSTSCATPSRTCPSRTAPPTRGSR